MWDRAPWLALFLAAGAIACAGVATSSVTAAAWWLDGTRASWTAAPRALVVWMVGSGGSVLCGLVLLGAGALALRQRAS